MAAGDGTELEHVRSSIVKLKIGNRTYDMVRNPKCPTCMHPARFQIEAKLLQNFGYPAVSRYVSELNAQRRDGSTDEYPPLTATQIRKHFEGGHCPAEGEVGRALAEQRARELGIELAAHNGQYLDSVIVQHAVISRGYELLTEGKIEPDVKDMLSASKFLAEHELGQSNTTSEDQWQEFMSIYFNAVQSIVTHEQWNAITAKIKQHPAFVAVQAHQEQTPEQPIDAEIVEEV